MSSKNSKTFNHLVFQKAYKRLRLTPTERIVFFKLLGFLIRNDRPFPYSVVAMSEITGHDKRTIFRALERIEKLRLIERIGFGKNRKFKRGSILSKILTTVTSRLKKQQNKIFTTATLCHKKLPNRDIVSPNRTSFILEHKEREKLSTGGPKSFKEILKQLQKNN